MNAQPDMRVARMYGPRTFLQLAAAVPSGFFRTGADSM
jgi:hypothetical protein